MGCDIHTIVQVKRDNKWEYIDELPEIFDRRNYAVFALLADIRNSFNIKGFEPKGLPDDLGGTKFGWKSMKEQYTKYYNEDTTRKVRLPNGEIKSSNDEEFRRSVSKEEYEKFNGSKGCGLDKYYIYDFESKGGKLEDIPYKEVFKTLQDYLDYYYEDEYNKEFDDYGDWRVDFDCEDYHSHSYLSLKELEDFNYDDFNCVKVKVIKDFFDKFYELGGKLPEGMIIDEEVPNDFKSIIQYAFQPMVIVKWKANEKENPLIEGIKELQDIAKKYNVESDNIRIVFAFDN